MCVATFHADMPLTTSQRVVLERWTVAALVAAFVVGVAWVASEPTPLGHDESVYALWAHHWLEGTPATGVAAHRASGAPAVLALVQALGFDSEPALRALSVAAGGALVAATWALAGRWPARWRGWWPPAWWPPRPG